MGPITAALGILSEAELSDNRVSGRQPNAGTVTHRDREWTGFQGCGLFRLGGVNMRISVKAFVILAVCLAAARGAKAIDMSQPFVAVTAPRTPVNLGEVCGPNLKEVGAKFNAHVVANCPYHISASFDGLRHQNRRIAISPKHMTVTINGRQVPVGTGRVPIAARGPTPRGGVDVPVELQVGVKAKASYPAGRYNGTLVITITAGF